MTIKLKNDRVHVSYDDGNVEMARVLWATPSTMKQGILNVGLRTESRELFIVYLDGDGRDDSKGLVVST